VKLAATGPLGFELTRSEINLAYQADDSDRQCQLDIDLKS